MVKIYGLVENWGFSFLGVEICRMNQDHSELWGLVNQIEHSKVGIELPKMPCIPLPKEVTIEIPEIYQNLEARLKEKNVVCNLDDDEIFEEFTKINIALARAKKLSPLKIYKKMTRMQYLHFVERDKKMFAKINTESPDVAFIGGAHAYYAYLQDAGHQIFVEAPINLDQVQREIELNFHYSYNQKMFDTAVKHMQPLIYKIFSLDKEIDRFRSEMAKIENHALVCERRYSILKHKKVESIKQKPDYVGSWAVNANRQNLPAEGFFEIHILKQDGDIAMGIIKDALGFANFQGKFTSDSVDLEKIYFDASELAINGSIRYTGSGHNFCYSGNYKGEKPNREGSFLMAKYKPGIEKLIIEAEDGKKLLSQVRQGAGI